MGLDQYLRAKTTKREYKGPTGACSGIFPVAPEDHGMVEIGYWRKAYDQDILISQMASGHYDDNDDQETWFNKIKDVCERFGYAREVKEYKNNPDSYKGHVGDVSTAIRVRITTKSQTPDLYQIMKLLGKDRMLNRIK